MLKKIFIFTVLFLFIFIELSFADKLIIPFDVYPKEIQKLFKKEGYKLDLSGNDRTKSSWGFIINEGVYFSIYTYESITREELNIVKKIVFSLDNIKPLPQKSRYKK